MLADTFNTTTGRFIYCLMGGGLMAAPLRQADSRVFSQRYPDESRHHTDQRASWRLHQTVAYVSP